MDTKVHNVYILHDNWNSDLTDWDGHIKTFVQDYITENNLPYQVHEIFGEQEMRKEFERKTFTSYDKIIYPNVWGAMPIYVKHLIENSRTVPPKTYGFWRRGSFINADANYRPIWNRDYRKSFERALHRCIDKSFLLTDLHVNQFRHFICRPKLKPWRAIKCNFPLKNIPNDIRNDITETKQDLIVFPFKNPTQLEDKIIYDLKRTMAPTMVHAINENHKITREQYLYQCSTAKIMFLPLHYESIGQFIYEAYALKCIPVVPDIEYYRDFVPEEFRYNPEVTLNIYNYTLMADQLTNKLKHLIVHYNEYMDVIEQKLKYLTDTYYTTEFLNIVFNKE